MEFSTNVADVVVKVLEKTKKNNDELAQELDKINASQNVISLKEHFDGLTTPKRAYRKRKAIQLAEQSLRVKPFWIEEQNSPDIPQYVRKVVEAILTNKNAQRVRQAKTQKDLEMAISRDPKRTLGDMPISTRETFLKVFSPSLSAAQIAAVLVDEARSWESSSSEPTKTKEAFAVLKEQLKKTQTPGRHSVLLSTARTFIESAITSREPMPKPRLRRFMYDAEAYEPELTKKVKSEASQAADDRNEEIVESLDLLEEAEGNSEIIEDILGTPEEYPLRDLFMALQIALSARPGELCDDSGNCLLEIGPATEEEISQLELPLAGYLAVSIFDENGHLQIFLGLESTGQKVRELRDDIPTLLKNNLWMVSGTQKTREDNARKPLLTLFSKVNIRAALDHWTSVSARARINAKERLRLFLDVKYSLVLYSLRRLGARMAVENAQSAIASISPGAGRLAVRETDVLYQLALRQKTTDHKQAFKHYL